MVPALKKPQRRGVFPELSVLPVVRVDGDSPRESLRAGTELTLQAEQEAARPRGCRPLQAEAQLPPRLRARTAAARGSFQGLPAGGTMPLASKDGEVCGPGCPSQA